MAGPDAARGVAGAADVIWSDAPTDGQIGLLDHLTDFRLDLAQAQSPSAEEAERRWWSVLIELRDISIDDFARAAGPFADDLLIPVAYGPEDRRLDLPRQPVAIYARRPFIKALNRQENAFGVMSVHLGSETPEAYLDFDAAWPDLSPLHADEDTVVMAVIDDGIAIGHDLFRLGPVSSRVAHATILDASPTVGGGTSVGRALGTPEIDAALAAATFGGILDEDRFYAMTGIVDWSSTAVSPVARAASHGTHVTALAAGHAMTSKCTTRPIICASLPTSAVEDTTGADFLPSVYLAFHVLTRQARRFRTDDGTCAPVVFNFSFGNSGGPHDGTGLFERLFEHYFGPGGSGSEVAQKAWLTLPAGNLNLLRLHAVAKGSGTTRLDLSVLPDDRTPSVVQMWMPTSPTGIPSAEVGVRVTTPSGQCGSIRARDGEVACLRNDSDAEIARLSCEYEPAPTARLKVCLALCPTATRSERAPVAPFGTWSIAIDPREGDTQDLEIWVRRDETLPGTRSGGRQAYFDNDDYERFDRFGAPLPVDPEGTQSPIRRSGSLSGFAGGSTPIVVGAFTAKEAEISRYSGAGPPARRDLAPPVVRDGPDLTARGDESWVLRGVPSAGSRSGSWVRMSGTSMASPRVARAAADDIRHWNGAARAWSSAAVRRMPFHLADKTTFERAGAGGISIPVRTGPTASSIFRPTEAGEES